jgi:hypothetical protein
LPKQVGRLLVADQNPRSARGEKLGGSNAAPRSAKNRNGF